MNKILSIALLSASVFASAQVSLSGKANLLFKTDKPTWENIQGTAVTAYNNSGKNNVGFNVGLSAKINLPVSLFLMPEIYYTTFKTEFEVPENNTTIEVKSNRVDVPVLLGYRLLGDNLGIFLGPVASYNLSTDNQYNDFKENALNNFTVGYQFGAQAQIQKLILNARYEGAFTKDQRDFINNNAGTNERIRYDSRPSLFMVGIGYQF
ncbi:outer membrane beta-barrel protein [Kaistella montana]|uniref:Outer membrane beta-barrel protein n=1 Tax=Kaistella montana TaxID=1849733 RepID=A0ABW5KBP1_9FLAO|nr:outer membrane beta-barrel protein [Kaistella montana]MCQ4035682.1 PorT family protein [Kaistella montana]